MHLLHGECIVGEVAIKKDQETTHTQRNRGQVTVPLNPFVSSCVSGWITERRQEMMDVKVPSIGQLALTVTGIDDTFYHLSL